MTAMMNILTASQTVDAEIDCVVADALLPADPVGANAVVFGSGFEDLTAGVTMLLRLMA